MTSHREEKEKTDEEFRKSIPLLKEYKEFVVQDLREPVGKLLAAFENPKVTIAEMRESICGFNNALAEVIEENKDAAKGNNKEAE